MVVLARDLMCTLHYVHTHLEVYFVSVYIYFYAQSTQSADYISITSDLHEIQTTPQEMAKLLFFVVNYLHKVLLRLRCPKATQYSKHLHYAFVCMHMYAAVVKLCPFYYFHFSLTTSP